MTAGVIGREVELDQLRTFLSGDVNRTEVFLLEGDAGIGKTTVWHEGVHIGQQRGLRVLACRVSESERGLPYIALTDLLGESVGEIHAELPEPQQHALDVVLLRRLPDESRADERTVAAATLTVVRALSARRPLLIAIDDAQWLDVATAEALAFVMRRLEPEPICALIARRSSADEELPLGLNRAAQAGRLRRQMLGPLSASDSHRVLRAQLDRPVSYSLARRLHEASGGNPMYALELARALGDRDLGPAEPLPLSAGLRELVAERLATLPGPVVEVVGIASASSRPTLSLFERAGANPEAVDAAVAAEVLESNGLVFRFTHPLLASAAYDRLGPAERRALHRDLALVVEDPDERARHLALGADEPSAEIARELEAAARRTFSRGASIFAAELAERALATTPPANEDDVRTRTILAADVDLRIGRFEHAAGLLGPFATDPEAAARLGSIRVLQGRDAEATGLLELADTHPETSPRTRARAALERATTDPRRSVSRVQFELSSRALDLARDTNDPELIVQALQRLAFYDAWAGRDFSALAREAREIAQLSGNAAAELNALSFGAVELWFADAVAAARPVLTERLERSSELGDAVLQAETSASLSELERRAGNLAPALRYAEQGLAIAEAELYVRGPLAYTAALARTLVGDVDGALTAARLCSDWAPAGPRYSALQAGWAHGFLALTLGDTAAAAAHFRPLPEHERRIGLVNPTAVQFHADAVEAFAAEGDVTEAEVLTNDLDHRGRSQEHPWAMAATARCRGLIAAATGDTAASARFLQHAITWYEGAERPIELARTLLAHGQIERRGKHHAAARSALTRALELFDTLGAARWAEKAADDLARIPGRARSSGELTETERRVAELVAGGLSNKEVAAKLFVTVRTVEANLSKVYAKLGIRSRTGLASRLPRRSEL